jgi:hypothetical protein
VQGGRDHAANVQLAQRNMGGYSARVSIRWMAAEVGGVQ